MRRVFLIEDDTELAHILSRHLENANYDVSVYHRGDEGLSALIDERPDLVVLDVMLPGMDGLEILRELRKSSDLLVLMISARGSELDRVLGLELGGDDYLTKPFSAREMVARVKALFRRAHRQKQVSPGKTPAHTLEVGGLVLDVDGNAVCNQGSRAELTQSEFSVLSRMMKTPGKVFTREELTRCLDRDSGYRSRAVDVHVGNLRKKISNLGLTSNPLRSVRGVGYRFDALNYRTPRVVSRREEG